MLNTDEGWVLSSQGAVFHYTTPPGISSPTWQRVKSSSLSTFQSLSVIGSNEWYAVQGGGLVHYQDNAWQYLPSSSGHLLDFTMINPDEGWGVGDQGVIVHYIQGELQPVPVPSPTNDQLNAIVMLNSEEGSKFQLL
jgi:photosystem II stability/assembly factor-like uncharacterized protein